ncbi:glycosyltransferase family A protein [Salinivibrio sp. ES.052]|uniref:glycosyltransferase family A protein n=1 Tax=Salinivibrio sp. ES.052 TaxID=1882823 RepID=UPI00092B5EF4|nr:glycosyltransferase family 2 protein [Salinivibrio sp. ES.052]SIN79254.1 Glycosyl transferase family 2 [Salinivibrio sp. ES.052]
MIDNRKNNAPFFSVIMPIYNKEPHIARAINSVLRQTYTNLELIVVCDPSTDNSNNEVTKFNDDRIRVFHRNEAGPGGYAARNLGIQQALGPWIAFLDADDEWLDYHLNLFFTHIENSKNVGFIASRFIEAYDSNINKNIDTSETTQFISFKEYLRKSPFYTSSVAVKKEIIIQSGMFPEGKMKRGGDVDTWLRCIENINGYLLVNNHSVIYYKDAENMVTRQNFYTQEEIYNEDIVKLISKYQGTDVEEPLKLKYNNKLIYAWNQNLHLDIDKNFKIISRCYFWSQPFKISFFYGLSLLPMFLLKPTHQLLFKVVSFKRKVFSATVNRVNSNH